MGGDRVRVGAGLVPARDGATVFRQAHGEQRIDGKAIFGQRATTRDCPYAGWVGDEWATLKRQMGQWGNIKEADYSSAGRDLTSLTVLKLTVISLPHLAQLGLKSSAMA